MSRFSFLKKSLSESVLIVAALLIGAGVIYASYSTLNVLSGINGLGFKLPHDSAYYSVTGNNSGTANSQNDTKVIKNTGSGDLFVPSKTSTEWNNFLNNAPGISVGAHVCFDVSASFWQEGNGDQEQQDCSSGATPTNSVSGATLVCDPSGNNCTNSGYSSGTYSEFTGLYNTGECDDIQGSEMGLAHAAGVTNLSDFYGKITALGTQYSCP